MIGNIYHFCRESLLKPFLKYWDQVLVAVLSLSIVGMVVALLIPTPHLEIVLGPAEADQQFPKGPLASSSLQQPSSIGTSSSEPDELNVLSVQDEKSEREKVDNGGEGGSFGEAESWKKHSKDSHPKEKKPKVIPMVNINTAGMALLDELPGVGPKMAEKIILYRKGIGKFQTIEELKGVKGIGEKKFAKMKPYLKL
ncbi:MAG: helix-hairpin-helix domain-containing protein [Cyanobacteria bacterium]|nr:helix-hairpin-helix domain-containing protein [Cyanobacteriota bacterium]